MLSAAGLLGMRPYRAWAMPVASGWFRLRLLDAHTGAAFDGIYRDANGPIAQVMAGLDPKSRELLRTSQRRWVAFREAEHEAMEGPWRQDKGTIIRVLTVSADLSAIKERVQELQLYGPDGG